MQVKAMMVDSANDSVSGLKSELAAARNAATRASAHAQESCAAAVQREAAATKRASSLQCVLQPHLVDCRHVDEMSDCPSHPHPIAEGGKRLPLPLAPASKQCSPVVKLYTVNTNSVSECE